MNIELVAHYETVQEKALDREINRRNKVRNMRRVAHHNNHNQKRVRDIPNRVHFTQANQATVSQ